MGNINNKNKKMVSSKKIFKKLSNESANKAMKLLKMRGRGETNLGYPI